MERIRIVILWNFQENRVLRRRWDSKKEFQRRDPDHYDDYSSPHDPSLSVVQISPRPLKPRSCSIHVIPSRCNPAKAKDYSLSSNTWTAVAPSMSHQLCRLQTPKTPKVKGRNKEQSTLCGIFEIIKCSVERWDFQKEFKSPTDCLYELIRYHQDHLETWTALWMSHEPRKLQTLKKMDQQKSPEKSTTGRHVEITGIGLSTIESKSIRGVPKDSEKKSEIWMWVERRA
ncbi:unnamed protein product [Caenorhabditis nigoni]